jgi:hypothetical protein
MICCENRNPSKFDLFLVVLFPVFIREGKRGLLIKPKLGRERRLAHSEHNLQAEECL